MHLRGRKLEKVIGEDQIKERVKGLAKEIESSFGKEFVVVGLLKGSFIFVSDLVREFSFSVPVDFMRVASYGGSMESSGEVKILKDVEVDLLGRSVLIVDDILDTGFTLSKVVDHIKGKNPLQVKTCVLLDKKSARKVPFEADFVGFEVPNKFLVGYGLDWDEMGRNFRDIYAVL